VSADPILTIFNAETESGEPIKPTDKGDHDFQTKTKHRQLKNQKQNMNPLPQEDIGRHPTNVNKPILQNLKKINANICICD